MEVFFWVLEAVLILLGIGVVGFWIARRNVIPENVQGFLIQLAVPVIMAGLRNSIVLIIGIATIAALIGASGLGAPIFRGLINARMDLIIIGGIGVSILALLIDGIMAMVERWAIPKGLKK